ncbi:MAG: hypothetical protein GY862_18405 [Gammaproteobacteria bacterium]|nr:hypothetical protein [Gammaproteobacteria bacterium]
MSIKIEQASKLAIKEIQAMPIGQLMAEIQANKNSQLAITIRELTNFAEFYFDEPNDLQARQKKHDCKLADRRN